MKSIGDKLRDARKTQGRSIEDMALATRINVKFLREIEHGITPDVPNTYLRAFITDYAREVGLNGAELLKELDNIQVERRSEAATKISNIKNQSTKNNNTTGRRLTILFVVVSIIIIGFVASILWLHHQNTRKPVEEISFSEIIKEQEQKINPAIQSTDSMAMKSSGLVRQDTLVLLGVASESLWVRISIDDAPSVEYKIPKFNRKQWIAKKSFLISLGNAAGISFTINGQRIGPLSTTNRPMRNVLLNRETMAKYKTKSP